MYVGQNVVVFMVLVLLLMFVILLLVVTLCFVGGIGNHNGIGGVWGYWW